MQIVHQKCCGLDVHKKTVVACVLISTSDRLLQKHIRTFSTMTADLLALSDWLDSLEVSQVAMESSGIYWRPIFNLLEEGREIMLVNPQHMKAVPGRKTDVKDSEWLADLLRHGLLQASFIPSAPIRQLREITRYRKSLIQERAQEVNRLHKLLETANIKLSSVATDIMGKSPRQMLELLLGGEQDTAVVADLARGRLRAKIAELRQALEARLQPHHTLLIKRLLAHIDFLEESVAQLQVEIEKYLAPFEQAMELLQSIAGINEAAAFTLVSEVGVDMSRFPSAKHLASWAGVCPGNRQSGGKRLSGATRKGNPYVRAVLSEVAWAISHTKNNSLSEQYHRFARRIGKKRAIVAISHSVLVIVYHILNTKEPYTDLGVDYFDKLDSSRVQQHHVRRLEQLGYSVTLTPKEVA